MRPNNRFKYIKLSKNGFNPICIRYDTPFSSLESIIESYNSTSNPVTKNSLSDIIERRMMDCDDKRLVNLYKDFHKDKKLIMRDIKVSDIIGIDPLKSLILILKTITTEHIMVYTPDGFRAIDTMTVNDLLFITNEIGLYHLVEYLEEKYTGIKNELMYIDLNESPSYKDII